MYAVYIVYNNEKTIGQSLKSVLPHVEKVVIIDGAFKTYPHKTSWSTDNTKNIAEKLCGDKLIWVTCEKPWNQVEKRNQYLTKVPDGELFIIMDSDDVLRGKVESEFRRIKKNHLCIGVKVVRFYPDWEGSHLTIPEEAWSSLTWKKAEGIGRRIYRKQENMEYRVHHSTIYVDQQLVSRNQHIITEAFLYSLHLKTWKEYMADIIYRLERPSSVLKRNSILETYTGGREPSEEIIRIKNEL